VISDLILKFFKTFKEYGDESEIESWDLGNYKSSNVWIKHADSRGSCSAKVCFSKLPAPTVLMLEEKF